MPSSCVIYKIDFKVPSYLLTAYLPQHVVGHRSAWKCTLLHPLGHAQRQGGCGRRVAGFAGLGASLAFGTLKDSVTNVFR